MDEILRKTSLVKWNLTTIFFFPSGLQRRNLKALFHIYSYHQSLTITDDVVKTYRNYTILYTLKDVIREVLSCLQFI